jgi:hypothetical protein
LAPQFFKHNNSYIALAMLLHIKFGPNVLYVFKIAI